MNKDLMFSSETDLWATPQGFFDELNEEFAFETDVCAIQKTQNAHDILHLMTTDSCKNGPVYVGAILRMAARSGNGYKKRQNPQKMERQ